MTWGCPALQWDAPFLFQSIDTSMKSMIMKQTLPSATKIYENGKVYQLNDVQAVRFKRAGIAEYAQSMVNPSKLKPPRWNPLWKNGEAENPGGRMSNYFLVTAPTDLVVSLAEVKAQARRTHDSEDMLITDYIREAMAACEGFTRRAFLPQTWKAVLPEFPDGLIRLVRPPLISITSVVYTATDGTQTTMSASDYSVDTNSLFGSVRPKYGTVWPAVQSDTPDAVVITYVCGWTTTSVAYQAKAATRQLAAYAYQERLPVNGNIVNKMPFSVESLLYQIALPEVI